MLVEASPIYAVAKAPAASYSTVCDAAAALDEETLSRAAARYLITHGVKKASADLLFQFSLMHSSTAFCVGLGGLMNYQAVYVFRRIGDGGAHFQHGI